VKQQVTREESSSINPYEALESWARAKVQDFTQQLLEQEMEEFIGRAKSERHVGSWTACLSQRPWKIRNFGMTGDTIHVRWPRVRNSEQRFESRILPLFHRKIEGVPCDVAGTLSSRPGDFELALRGYWET
jgi:putative transposase